MEGLGAWLFMSWNKPCEWFTFKAHGDTAHRDAWRGLRFKHDKLAPRVPKYLSVEFHHAVASVNVSASAQRARRLDLGDDGVVRNAHDGHLLLGRKRALPERTQFGDLGGTPDCLRAHGDVSEGVSEEIGDEFKLWPASKEGEQSQHKLHRRLN